jgi:hypothetical protein
VVALEASQLKEQGREESPPARQGSESPQNKGHVGEPRPVSAVHRAAATGRWYLVRYCDQPLPVVPGGSVR